MKIPTFAALCLMVTMSLGSAAAGEKDEDGKGKGDEKGHDGLALVVCKPVVCPKGKARHAKIVAAGQKVIPALSKDLKECLKQLAAAKDKLKDFPTTVGPDIKAYREACKDELKAAREGGKDAAEKKE